CVIDHNIVPGMKRWSEPHYRDPWIIALGGFLLAGAFAIFRQQESAALRHRRLLLFLAPGFYLFFLYGFWPDITREDDPPFYPLVPPGLSAHGPPLLTACREKLPGFLRLAVPWAACAGFVGWLVATEKPWDRENRQQIANLAAALKLTTPDEYFMDA